MLCLEEGTVIPSRSTTTLSMRWLCGAAAFAMATPVSVIPCRICGEMFSISLGWCVIHAVSSKGSPYLVFWGKEEMEGGRARKISDDLWIDHLQLQVVKCFNTASSFKILSWIAQKLSLCWHYCGVSKATGTRHVDNSSKIPEL